jgi:murein DD-endopeptidase MepM/ murein hydrolase activator NlpD
MTKIRPSTDADIPAITAIYAHLNQIEVKNDQEVESGSVIGRVNSGETDSSLHFEIRKSSNALNPNDWLE